MSVYVLYIVGNGGSIVGQREDKERYRRDREPGAQGSMGRGPAGSSSAWGAGTRAPCQGCTEWWADGVRWQAALTALGFVLATLHKLMQLDTQARRVWMRL